MEILYKEFNLLSSLKSLIDNTQIRTEQKELKFTYTPHPKIPKIVFGDEIRLRQILINLLDNAIKYTSKGYIKFSIYPVKEKIRFIVKDTGIGIASEEINNIFNPFHRVKDNFKQIDGVGLGLSISQKLARLMNSEIEVKSKTDIGSKFWFDMDLPTVNSLINYEQLTTNDVIGYTNQKYQVLVVDDKQENRMVLKDILQTLDFSITEAIDGIDAIQKSKDQKTGYNFYGYKMPNVNGLEATKKIRKIPHLENTIIIAISANAFEYTIKESLEAGCNGFIPKPITIEKVIKEINKHLPIEWIYKNEKEISGKQKIESLNMKSNAHMFYKLCNLIEFGERSDIFKELDRIKNEEKDFLPFVDHVRKMVKNFQLISALKFIKDQIDAN